MELVDDKIETLKHEAGVLLGAPVRALVEVGGGRNSRVYRLCVESSQCFALKCYFRHASESRARMETEFASLEFLWRGGVRNIPMPLVSSPKHGFAIYSWINGRRISSQDVTSVSVEAANAFLCDLAELRSILGSERLSAASEACFSGPDIITNLENRLQPLRERSENQKLQSFLNHDLIPALERICDWSRRQMGEAFERKLELQDRTLSPSDFGFHNALATESGRMFFLDFEYFGWDDPAKTLSDFVLHPGMVISPALKRQFSQNLVQQLPCRRGLRERVRAYYPLFGLKWCLILLNEFLPDQLQRRRFAGMNEQDCQRKQIEQLAKAENMLSKTLSEYEHFPYLD